MYVLLKRLQWLLTLWWGSEVISKAPSKLNEEQHSNEVDSHGYSTGSVFFFQNCIIIIMHVYMYLSNLWTCLSETMH